MLKRFLVVAALFTPADRLWDTIRALQHLLVFPPQNCEEEPLHIICCNFAGGGIWGELPLTSSVSGWVSLGPSLAKLLSVLTQLPQCKHWEQLCRHRWEKGVCMCVWTHTVTQTHTSTQHCDGTSSKHIHCQNMTNWVWTSPYHTNTSHHRERAWVPQRVG